MEKQGIKSNIVVLTTVLIASISLSIMLIPTTDAHTTAWKIPTIAYVDAIPNPVGVGQTTWIYMWIDKMPDGTAMFNDWRWHNYKLTITKPDGTTESKTWETIVDTTSSHGYTYTPTQVGTYILKFEFPGQDANAYSFNPTSAFRNDTYLPSSATTTLTVQQDVS
jgi:hypothetical protein